MAEQERRPTSPVQPSYDYRIAFAASMICSGRALTQ